MKRRKIEPMKRQQNAQLSVTEEVINMQAVLGGGCFWCLEAAYQLIDGVTEVVPGYAGGHVKNPNYYQVGEGRTGHAEVVRINFDDSKLSFKDILEIFWTIHDPTTKDRQGNDVGPQYRSIILYEDEVQKNQAESSIKEVQKLWKDPIVTEIKALERFYEAEPEHHNYFKNHPEQAYCQVIINPKIEKLRTKFASRLRK